MRDNDHLTEIGARLERLTSVLARRRMLAALRLARRGRYAEAERALLAGQGTIRDDHGEAAVLLARIYAQQGRYEKAAEQYQRVLAVFPDDVGAARGAAAVDAARVRHARPTARSLASLALALLVAAAGAAAVWLVSTEFRSVETRMAALSAEMSAALREQTSLQQAMQEDLEGRIAASVRELSSVVESVKTDLSAIESATSALGEEVSNEYSSLRQSLNEINESRARIEQALASLDEDVTRLDVRLVGVDDRLPGLVEQIGRARADLAALPVQGASIDALTARIRTLESMLAELNASLNDDTARRGRRRR